MSWIEDYRRVKKGLPDTLLLWRQGDFYEALDGDAVDLAGALDVVLVTIEGKTPMSGFPHAAFLDRVSRLVAGGFKVAVVEPDGNGGGPPQVFGQRAAETAAEPVERVGDTAEGAARQPALFQW